MKRSLLALLLVMILLLGYGCGVSPDPEVTEGTQATADTATEGTTAPTVTTAPTEATTEPTTEATEPVTEATEPVTEATEPTTAPKPTKPVQTTEPTTTAKPTQPATTTKPTTPKPEQPTEPTPDEPGGSSASGSSLSGWWEKDGNKYYLDSEGNIHTGWLTLDGERYYFHEDGRMAVGKVNVPGSGTRYFTSTGKECILVNPWNYVPSDYSVKLSKYGDYKVATSCLSDLKQMIADCKSAGNKAVVVSAYRSHSYQAGLYERRVQRFVDQGYSRKEAEVEAAKRVAIAGTSEHELGLAMDIVDVNYQNLDKKQENTAAQKWLMANSWKYGFILRYPNNKSDVTGIIYEPWHYRYVGKELAKELHDSGLCLEEYFAQLS